MGQDAFVDVAYSGLEVGRRLKLRQVGPHTAYLEHGTPMPVGAEMVIRTDEGLAIPVVVVRVHEQVAGAEMPPGMRIRALDLAGAAAEWWSCLVSREDPTIPEPELARPAAITVPPPGPDLTAVPPPGPDLTAVPPPGPDLPPVPPPGPELPPVVEGEDEIQASDTVVMNAAGAPAGGEDTRQGGGNGAAAVDDSSVLGNGSTVVMSAAEISRITDAAGEPGTGDGEGGEEADAEPASAEAKTGWNAEAESAKGNGTPGSNGDEMRGGRRRRRRRRR